VSITIRLATHGDEPALVELNEVVQAMHASTDPSVFRHPVHDEISAWFQGLLGRDDAQIWLAEEAGTPVGFVHVTVQERPENPFCRERKYLEVTSISVRVDKQRSGIGRQLMEHVARTAPQNGICDVELSCWCFNSGAQEAFRRLGFVPRWVRFRRSVTPSNSPDPNSQAPAPNPPK
jgi:ribosomal protein S18 acetylase RimI-like enzyme